jgi:hypothetical protein
LFHADGYPILTGAGPGYASIATFPDKNPTPASANPYWLAIALALVLALSLLAARRLTPTTRH